MESKVESQEIKVSIENITQEHIDFDRENNACELYHPLEIDMSEIGTQCITLRDYSMLASLLFIPHTIFINGVGEVKAGININLRLRGKEKDPRIVKSLILGAFNEYRQRQIDVGYYWLKEDKGIVSQTWYRPLLVKKARALDYELVKKANYTLPNVNDYFSIESDADDFKALESNCLIKLMPSDEELTNLQKIITFYTVYYNIEKERYHHGKMLGIVGFRPYTIEKQGVKYLAAQLCYFDCIPSMATYVLAKLFHELKKDNYIAVHGVLMSGMESAIKDLSLSLSQPTNLNFFNVEHGITKYNKVAMLFL